MDYCYRAVASGIGLSFPVELLRLLPLLKSLTTEETGLSKTFLDNLILPETGSLPKYLTLKSCPTSIPKALGWWIYINENNKNVLKTERLFDSSMVSPAIHFTVDRLVSIAFFRSSAIWSWGSLALVQCDCWTAT